VSLTLNGMKKMSKQTIQEYKKRKVVLKHPCTECISKDNDKIKLALGLTAAVALLAGLCIGLDNSRR
jgi:hypothetical protein